MFSSYINKRFSPTDNSATGGNSMYSPPLLINRNVTPTEMVRLPIQKQTIVCKINIQARREEASHFH